jgi:ParB family chromosome partitioning protein
MTRKGGRVDLASLTSSVGENSPVDPDSISDGLFRTNVPLAQLVPNPRNPRQFVGNLEDLATIKDRQLQPGTAISRRAWLKLWPDDELTLGDAKLVVVNGNRRLAAAAKFGRDGLDVVVRDSLAVDRATVIWAAVVENIDRENLDVLEEARAIELMVNETGSANEAAERLGRSKGWVSQRRALLKLAPELQERLRAGELALRTARSLAKVPQAEQVAKWQAAQDKADQPAGDSEGGESEDEGTKPPSAASPKAAARALRRLRTDPATLASAVIDVFTDEQIADLVSALNARQT